VSIAGDYSGKIFYTDVSVAAAIYIQWLLPGLRSHVTVILSPLLALISWAAKAGMCEKRRTGKQE